MKLPRVAGGRSAPHVPSRTIAMCPLTAARASRTTKSMLGMPMSVVIIDTGTPSNRPVGQQGQSSRDAKKVMRSGQQRPQWGKLMVGVVMRNGLTQQLLAGTGCARCAMAAAA